MTRLQGPRSRLPRALLALPVAGLAAVFALGVPDGGSGAPCATDADCPAGELCGADVCESAGGGCGGDGGSSLQAGDGAQEQGLKRATVQTTSNVISLDSAAATTDAAATTIPPCEDWDPTLQPMETPTDCKSNGAICRYGGRCFMCSCTTGGCKLGGYTDRNIPVCNQ